MHAGPCRCFAAEGLARSPARRMLQYLRSLVDSAVGFHLVLVGERASVPNGGRSLEITEGLRVSKLVSSCQGAEGDGFKSEAIFVS